MPQFIVGERFGVFLRKEDIGSQPLFDAQRFCKYVASKRGREPDIFRGTRTAIGVFVPAKVKLLGALTGATKVEDHILPKWTGTWKGQTIDIVHFGIGAPVTAATLEEMACLGTKNIITLGSAGGLQHDCPPGSLILPTGALREEGTSYHYLPPEESVSPDATALNALKESLAAHDLTWREGTVWTTDAMYREYASKVRDYREQGILGVEMECSALFAAARVLGMRAATLLYISDVLSEEWHPAFVEPEITTTLDKAGPAVLDAALALDAL